MNLLTLQNALLMYGASAECSEAEREDAFKAIQELSAVRERYTNADIWKLEVCVVSPSTMMDMLNHITYDDYGRIARREKGEAPFHYYADKVRKYLPDLTNDVLRDAFTYLKDLWHDNEEQCQNTVVGTYLSCNTPDQFFKQATACIDGLVQLTAETYKDTELHSIKICINDIEYHFYDSAALVQGLIDTLEYARNQL